MRNKEMATHACKAGGWRCGNFRDQARWSGSLAQHCTGCGEMFLSTRAADMHITHDNDGRPVCHDPVTRIKRDGSPMFEKIDKLGWEPPYAWREFRPDLPGRAKAFEGRAQKRAVPDPGSQGTPQL